VGVDTESGLGGSGDSRGDCRSVVVVVVAVVVVGGGFRHGDRGGGNDSSGTKGISRGGCVQECGEGEEYRGRWLRTTRVGLKGGEHDRRRWNGRDNHRGCLGE